MFDNIRGGALDRRQDRKVGLFERSLVVNKLGHPFLLFLHTSCTITLTISTVTIAQQPQQKPSQFGYERSERARDTERDQEE